jgi:hypothetical protein
MAVLGKVAGSLGKSATKKAISGGLTKAAGSAVKSSFTKAAGNALFGAVKSGLTQKTASGGWGSVLADIGSSFLGGTGGASGSIFEAMLGGLGGAADAFLSKEAVEESGKQNRRTLDFKAALDDYYQQKNKVRKRAALDTYGQFSTMDRWAPGARPAPALDQPAKPGY